MLVFILALLGHTAQSQMMDPPKWKAEIQQENLTKGDTLTVLFTAEIPQDWYMYSSDFDPNLGSRQWRNDPARGGHVGLFPGICPSL